MFDSERTAFAMADSLGANRHRGNPMDTLCHACSSGPSGFAGHTDLMAQSLGDDRISLRCRRCGSPWSRTFVRDGDFAWACITERMAHSPHVGIPVPPRTTP
jgi:hypothetical protein